MSPNLNDLSAAAPSPEEQERIAALRALFVERVLAVTDNVMDIQKTLALVFPNVEDNQAALLQLDDLKRCLDSFRPLNADQVANLQGAWDVEYTYESNRIEGNTLTLNETHMVINEGITIGGKSLNEHLEAINHRDALEAIKRIASNGAALTEREMLDIHRIILRAIDNDNAGFYRRVPVRVRGSERVFPNPLKVADHVQDMFREYEADVATLHPVLLAAKMHHRLVWIHPFIDGNGRTARLLMNLILLRHGFPVANISAEPKNRADYYAAIQKADNGDHQEFDRFIIRTEKDALFRWLSMISGSDAGTQGGIGVPFYERIAPYL